MNSQFISTITAILLSALLGSCSADFFGGGGMGFAGGHGAGPDRGNTANPGTGDYLPTDPANPDRILTGDDLNTQSVYVPLMVWYEGQYSGSDARFTFYVRRKSPRLDPDMTEAITSVRKKFISHTLPEFCACGRRNEMEFYWEHIHGRRGALHTAQKGEWLMAHYVSDNNWKSKGLKTVPVGEHSVFLGADTENPNFIMRPEGDGYLRTEDYAPNSIFGNAKKWAHRDDMRLAFSCAIDQCPAESRNSTTLFFDHHPSAVPNE